MVGKLVVIEGADASGKATQSRLLVERLVKEGFAAELFSFPRYEEFFGKLVRKYLSGEFGSLDAVKPEFAALLYSLDRYDALPAIEAALAEGKIVVCDRYTASNIAHQAAKFSGKEKQAFVGWVEGVESRLPRPLVTVYLDVPVEFSQGLMRDEAREKDLHEQATGYLERVREAYLELAGRENWVRIECVEGGKLLSIESIHSILWARAKKYL